MSRRLRKVLIIFMSSLSALACSLSHQLSTQSVQELQREDQDTVSLQPWTDLCLPVATMVGCLLSWIPLHFLGRRSTLELLSAPSLILGCCLTFTFFHLTVPHPTEPAVPYIQYSFVLGLCLQGLSYGLTFVAAPIYVLETVGDLSGKWASLSLLLITTQLSVAAGITAATILKAESNTYFNQLLPAACQIICLMGFYFLPESPRWLLLHKLRVDDAKIVLCFLKKYSSANYDICNELARFQQDEEKFKGTVLYLRLLFVAMGISCLWQLYGVHIYHFYAAWAFKFAGMSDRWDINTDVTRVCIRTVSVVVCTAVHSLCGRPLPYSILLMFSSGLATVALTVTGTCFYGFSQGDTWSTNVTWLPLTAYVVFLGAFWFGPGSQGNILANLVTPAPLRPTVLSLTGCVYWLVDLAATRLVKPMINTLYPFGTYWFFAGMSTVGLILIVCIAIPNLYKTEMKHTLYLRSTVVTEETDTKT